MTSQEYELTTIQMHKLEEDVMLKLQTQVRALVGKWVMSILLTVSITSYLASANWSNLLTRVDKVEDRSIATSKDVEYIKQQTIEVNTSINNKITEISTDMKWIKGKLSK